MISIAKRAHNLTISIYAIVWNCPVLVGQIEERLMDVDRAGKGDINHLSESLLHDELIGPIACRCEQNGVLNAQYKAVHTEFSLRATESDVRFHSGRR
jgi:hypothetical protein